MTEYNPNQATPPEGEPFADEPIPEGEPAAGGAGPDGAPSAKGREWLAQLEAMINDITTQAAPVARQVAAKAAELTAVAAVKAGPLAQRAAEATTDAGQKLAERAQSLAAELRGDQPGTAPEDVPWESADPSAATDPAETDRGPDATFEDASSGEHDSSRSSSI